MAGRVEGVAGGVEELAPRDAGLPPVQLGEEERIDDRDRTQGPGSEISVSASRFRC